MAAMNDVMTAVEKEVRSVPGVAHTLTSVGGGYSGSVNQGEIYVRLAPHEERVFSWARLVKGLVTLDPLAAFRGNCAQREVMQQVRGKIAQVRRSADAGAQHPVVPVQRRSVRARPRDSRARAQGTRGLRAKSCANAPPSSAWSTPTPRSS